MGFARARMLPLWEAFVKSQGKCDPHMLAAAGGAVGVGLAYALFGSLFLLIDMYRRPAFIHALKVQPKVTHIGV